MTRMDLARDQGPAYARVERLLELPMVLLAICFVAAIIVQDLRATPEEYRTVATHAERVIWGVFVAEYLLLLTLARRRWLYVRTHVPDLLVIVLPALRVLRIARALRALRLLRAAQLVSVAGFQWQEVQRLAARRGLGVMLAGIATIILAGSYLMHCAEAAVNPQFGSYGESVWWAIVTATTVGYGDAAPQTCEGRIVAAAFMFAGICMFGVVSATIAAYFVGADQQAAHREVLARLDAVAARLADLESANRRIATPEPTDTAQESLPIPGDTDREH
jgi:voltage-gated potassium channel